jgi:hypothetical protein
MRRKENLDKECKATLQLHCIPKLDVTMQNKFIWLIKRASGGLLTAKEGTLGLYTALKCKCTIYCQATSGVVTG